MEIETIRTIVFFVLLGALPLLSIVMQLAIFKLEESLDRFVLSMFAFMVCTPAIIIWFGILIK